MHKVLRQLVREAVIDFAAAKAARAPKEWKHIGDYNDMSRAKRMISVEVSDNGELMFIIGGMSVTLSTVESAALLDHAARALEQV